MEKANVIALGTLKGSKLAEHQQQGFLAQMLSQRWCLVLTKKTYKGWVTQTSTCVSGARHADFPDADLAEVDDESDFVCPVWNVPELLGQTVCLLRRPHQ